MSETFVKRRNVSRCNFGSADDTVSSSSPLMGKSCKYSSSSDFCFEIPANVSGSVFPPARRKRFKSGNFRTCRNTSSLADVLSLARSTPTILPEESRSAEPNDDSIAETISVSEITSVTVMPEECGWGAQPIVKMIKNEIVKTDFVIKIEIVM
ncbi:MAG: hypothetical protein LBT46_13810 [Planctomycetaceae bacterium]|nr:hypothetical protein [Planctomycetaceae bacterium]